MGIVLGRIVAEAAKNGWKFRISDTALTLVLHKGHQHIHVGFSHNERISYLSYMENPEFVVHRHEGGDKLLTVVKWLRGGLENER